MSLPANEPAPEFQSDYQVSTRRVRAASVVGTVSLGVGLTNFENVPLFAASIFSAVTASIAALAWNGGDILGGEASLDERLVEEQPGATDERIFKHRKLHISPQSAPNQL